MVLQIKNLPANAGDIGEVPALIPGLGRSLGGGNGNPFQYSCLEKSMDRRAWWATVHRVTKEWDTPAWLSMHELDLAVMGRLPLDSVAKCQHNFAACPADSPQPGSLLPTKFRQTSWQEKRYVSQHLSWKIFDSFPHIIPNGYVVKRRLYFSTLLLYCFISRL